jgi:hypothetical protein
MWEVWVVPIIAIAVWILGSLMKGSEPERSDRPPGPGGPRPQPGEPGATRPRSPGDLDKFLQEIQRRRRAAEERERPPQPQAERPPERTVERVPLSEQPAPRPRPQQPARPVQAPPPRRRPVRSVPDQPAGPPLARPVPEPRRPRVPAREVPAEPPLEVIPVPPRLRPPPTPAPSPSAPVAVVAEAVPQVEPAFPLTTRARQSPALAQLGAFLKSPQSMRAAILLQEILGPPVYQRRQRGRR